MTSLNRASRTELQICSNCRVIAFWHNCGLHRIHYGKYLASLWTILTNAMANCLQMCKFTRPEWRLHCSVEREDSRSQQPQRWIASFTILTEWAEIRVNAGSVWNLLEVAALMAFMFEPLVRVAARQKQKRNWKEATRIRSSDPLSIPDHKRHPETRFSFAFSIF